jgi:hypothetical protein
VKKVLGCLLGAFLFFVLKSVSGAVYCPDPQEVIGSLDDFNLQKNATDTLVDQDQENPQYQSGQRKPPKDPQDARLQFNVEPNCYSSQQRTLWGCQPYKMQNVQFTHVTLNKLRADHAVASCYYKTLNGTKMSVAVHAGSVGVYGVAKPLGGAWNYNYSNVYICRANRVQSCPFEFVKGRAPSPFDVLDE